MDTEGLIEYALNFEGKKIGIYGTGVGAIKVLNALGILNQFVHCYFETKPLKTTFLTKPVVEAKQENVKLVDCLIVASQYFVEIEEHLEGFNIENIYYAFKPEKFIGMSKNKKGVFVGKYTYDTFKTLDFPENISYIGSFTSINERASIGGKNHPLHYVSTHPMFYYKKGPKQNGYSVQGNLELEKNSGIFIGHDVWIGTNVVVLPGVSIGHGAVIGAGAVVTKDIPPYSIAVGVPAKVIKYRFSKDIIEALLKIKWWDWTEEKINKNIDLFYDPNEFVKKFTEEI